jgi:hypothetical protein
LDPDDLAKIGNAVEYEVSPLRPDGSLRPFVTIWGVRHGDSLYVRSAHGPDNPCFQRALWSGQGRIRAGGVERDVPFATPSAYGREQRKWQEVKATAARLPPGHGNAPGRSRGRGSAMSRAQSGRICRKQSEQ